MLVFHQHPLKTVGTSGIRLGRLPRWLKLLIKLAAISVIVVSANASMWPDETSFLTIKITNLLKSTYGVKQTIFTRRILILVAHLRLMGLGGFFRAPT